MNIKKWVGMMDVSSAFPQGGFVQSPDRNRKATVRFPPPRCPLPTSPWVSYCTYLDNAEPTRNNL